MEFHDPLESCPFNVFHRIRRSRMQFHITTCAQNHRHVRDLVQCPFDARHIVKHIEFEHHKSTCPARASVIDYAIHDSASQAKLKILPIDVKPVGRWNEKWDDDPDVKTYDPIQYIKDKPIVYSLIGVSKAKRKNHRLQERSRYKRVIENGGENISRNVYYSMSMSTSSKFNTTVEVVHEIGDGTDEENKPLRPPSGFDNAHPTDETFHNYARQTSEFSGCMDLEKSTSKFDQFSNYSPSSVAVLSRNQRTSFSRKSSDNQWAFENSPRTIDINAVKNSSQEECSINDKAIAVSGDDDYHFNQYQSKDQKKFSTVDTDNIVSSEDDYQFNQYHSKDQEKFSTPDADNIVSCENDYEFSQYHSKDQGKFSTPDINNIISSENDYQHNQYHSKDQEKSPTSDTNSIVSSMDNYRFVPYQPENQENGSTSYTDSIVSSKVNYQFTQYQPENQENGSTSYKDSNASSKDGYEYHQNQYTVQKQYSISDTISIISGMGKYQFQQDHLEDQENFSISDAVSVASTKNKYQYSRPVIRTSSETSLSSSVSETSVSEIDSIYSCEDDESVMNKSSKTIEETTENNKNNKEFQITDTVYNVSNESQYIITIMNGNSGMSPLSTKPAENFNNSMSNGTEYSRKYSINSIETNSTDNISIFDKLSRTIEELAMDSIDYKKKSESLDQEINKLKKLPSKNELRQLSTPVNFKNGKLFRRCAANFLNLGQ